MTLKSTKDMDSYFVNSVEDVPTIVSIFWFFRGCVKKNLKDELGILDEHRKIDKLDNNFWRKMTRKIKK